MGICAIGAIHLAVSRVIIAVTMNIDMLNESTGWAVALLGKILVVVTRILYFPIITLSLYSRQWFPGNWIYIPIVANSLVWGSVIYVFYYLWRKYLNRKHISAAGYRL